MPDGRPVTLIRLGHAPGVVVDVLDLGATVHRLEVAGGDGVRRNVVLGQHSVADYLASGDYLGGTIGRYANRIAQGRFTLHDTAIEVETHDRGNALHGGPDGFNDRVWTIAEADDEHVRLELTSPDGDMGYPGNLVVSVTYTVAGDTVRVDHSAVTDATTVVNLTNHAYFNLDGDGAGSVDEHELQVHADAFTPVDETGIPVGGHLPVDGTPFDLRAPRLVGSVARDPHPQVGLAQGIDHNLVLAPAPERPADQAADQAGSPLPIAALLRSRRTGLSLELRTDQPGLQVYTGNFLDGRSLSPAAGHCSPPSAPLRSPSLRPLPPTQPARRRPPRPSSRSSATPPTTRS